MFGKHIDHCEDSLTASVFATLLHLPAADFWSILQHAAYSPHFPAFPGEPTTISGWPNWDASGSRNSNRVVPDLFLRLPALDLIIEAKRWDDEMQSEAQWRDQVQAYFNEYPPTKGGPEVRLIALGGIWSEADQELPLPSGKKCIVHAFRWSRLLDACRRHAEKLSELPLVPLVAAQRRAMQDVIDLFAWHGFQTGVWFAEITPRNRNLENFTSSSAAFRASGFGWCSRPSAARRITR